jgi:hypothetical protein
MPAASRRGERPRFISHVTFATRIPLKRSLGAVGPGPSFIVLDKRENDPGSGLAEEFRPIAVVAVWPQSRKANFKRWGGGVVSQAVSDPAPKLHEHGELRWVDNVDQFKEEVAASAERWFGSHKAKIDIHIVIDCPREESR